MIVYIIYFVYIINALVIPQNHPQSVTSAYRKIPIGHQKTNAIVNRHILCKKGFLDCFKRKVVYNEPEIVQLNNAPPPSPIDTNQYSQDYDASQSSINSQTDYEPPEIISRLRDTEIIESTDSESIESIIRNPFKFIEKALRDPFDSQVESTILELEIHLVFEDMNSDDTINFQEFFDDYNTVRIKLISYSHRIDFSKKVVKVGDIDVKLTKKLGQGSFGVAYLAEIISTNENVVVKFTKFKHGDSTSNKMFLKDSYIREKEALRITDRLISFEDKLLVTVQKEIKGENLFDVLSKLYHSRDSQKIHEIKQEYYKLIDEFMNKYGLIHGDVAPRNIIMNSNGDLVLIDFGMAYSVDSKNKEEKLNYSRMQAKIEWEQFVENQKSIEPNLVIFLEGGTFSSSTS